MKIDYIKIPATPLDQYNLCLMKIQQSGMTQEAWCKKTGIYRKNLHHWKKHKKESRDKRDIEVSMRVMK